MHITATSISGKGYYLVECFIGDKTVVDRKQNSHQVSDCIAVPAA